MYDELAEVLKDNPFTAKLIKEWKRELESFLAGKITLTRLRFALDSDIKSLRKCKEQNKGNRKSRLHLELLPQPFQGSPYAPIWILLLNPGYSDMDRYDHLGLCPNCNKNLAMEETNSLHDVFDYGRKKGSALRKRQNILLCQLRLKKESSFSLIDEAFNTVKHIKCDVGGGYRWWKKVLFGDKGSSKFLLCKFQQRKSLSNEIGKKIFVLEYFPYHSTSFDRSTIEICSEYKKFWTKLVGWGVNHGRKFIIRGKYMDGALKKLKVDRSNSVRFKSARNVALTPANLEGAVKVRAAIVNCLMANQQKGKQK